MEKETAVITYYDKWDENSDCKLLKDIASIYVIRRE